MEPAIIIHLLCVYAVFANRINNKLIQILTCLSSLLAIISVIPILSYGFIIANVSYFLFMMSTLLLIKENIFNIIKNKQDEYKILKVIGITGVILLLIFSLSICITDFNDIFARYLQLIMAFMVACIGYNNKKVIEFKSA